MGARGGAGAARPGAVNHPMGISVDDDAEAYDQFLKAYQINNFPTFRDPSKQIPLMYGTTMYPDTYVIDRQGRVDQDCGPAGVDGVGNDDPHRFPLGRELAAPTT